MNRHDYILSYLRELENELRETGIDITKLQLWEIHHLMGKDLMQAQKYLTEKNESMLKEAVTKGRVH